MNQEQMIDLLRERTLKICELSLEVSKRGLAQAFVSLLGHTKHMTADVQPIDTEHREDSALPRPGKLAEVDINFYFYDFHGQQEQEEHFREQLAEADQYIAYLQLLLAQDKPIKMAAMRGAA